MDGLIHLMIETYYACPDLWLGTSGNTSYIMVAPLPNETQIDVSNCRAF